MGVWKRAAGLWRRRGIEPNATAAEPRLGWRVGGVRRLRRRPSHALLLLCTPLWRLLRLLLLPVVLILQRPSQRLIAR